MGWIGDVDSGEGRLQQVFFRSTRDKTRELCLAGTEREEKVCGQPTWFSGRLKLFVKYSYLEIIPRQSQEFMRI